ncbi:MAG: geranylgeranylglycerol-phosphate geranylgeranyltransferase [Flavobacteriaceae bacterium]|nr:geranylgeranylglycerol-phosphate geranylgeranyltransferase [Flavobacteriaceae bacterium]
MKIKDYLTFFRWKNLLIIILIQFLLKFVLFQNFNLSSSLNNLHFFLLTLSTICIAIAGYIINDINDVRADQINKPNKVFVGNKISFSKANNLFLILNSIGLLIGFYLTIYINKNSFFIIYIIASLLLYRYAVDLKKRLIISNLTVSFIVFLSIIIVAVFDLVPATNSFNNQSQIKVFNIVLVISAFAFFLTLLREIVKDLEDIEGDKKIRARTLPIVYGEKKTKIILVILGTIPLLGIIYSAFYYYKTNPYLTYYLITLVSLPLLYFLVRIFYSNTKKAYHKLSGLLKIIMLLGILTVLFL